MQTSKLNKKETESELTYNHLTQSTQIVDYDAPNIQNLIKNPRVGKIKRI